MIQSSALIPTHLTSPWRGPSQLSLSSVSNLNAEGKQLRFRLAFSAQCLTLCLFLTTPPPPLLSKCCLSLANSFKEAAVGCTLHSFLPKLKAAVQPPALSVTLALTKLPQLDFTSTCKWPWLRLCLLGLSYLYSAGRHTPTLSVAQHSCKCKGSPVASLMTSSPSNKCPYMASNNYWTASIWHVFTSRTESRTEACRSFTVDSVSLRIEAEPVQSPVLHSARL